MTLYADMPVLSGNYPETCFAKYGSMPLKAKYVHEMSLRILLHAIDSCANKYSRHIVPWVSLSVDFYVRGTCIRVFQASSDALLYCAFLHSSFPVLIFPFAFALSPMATMYCLLVSTPLSSIISFFRPPSLTHPMPLFVLVSHSLSFTLFMFHLLFIV